MYVNIYNNKLFLTLTNLVLSTLPSSWLPQCCIPAYPPKAFPWLPGLAGEAAGILKNLRMSRSSWPRKKCSWVKIIVKNKANYILQNCTSFFLPPMLPQRPERSLRQWLSSFCLGDPTSWTSGCVICWWRECSKLWSFYIHSYSLLTLKTIFKCNM